MRLIYEACVCPILIEWSSNGTVLLGQADIWLEKLHRWPVKPAVDLVTFCGMYVEFKTASIDAISLFKEFLSQNPTTLWLPTTVHCTPMDVLMVLTTL